MSEVKVNKLSPRSGTTVTLGDSGDTISIPSGVTLSNAGTNTFASATITGDLTVDTSTLYVDSTNNRVGIGTASPQNTLHVIKNALSGASYRTNAPLILENSSNNELQILSGNSGDGQIRFGDGDSNYRGAITYAHSDDSMKFVTTSSERMRIDSTGNVGINTTSPPGDFKFTVSGNDTILPGINSVNSTCVFSAYNSSSLAYLATRSNHPLNFRTNSVERMRIDTSGNVGIGTSSPSALLHVSSFDPKIKLTDTDTGASHLLSGSSSARNFDLVVDDGGSSGSPRFSVQIQNSGKFYILNSGNVGIGTDSPNNQLEIKSDTATVVTRLACNTGSGRDWGVASATDGAFGIYDYDAAAYRMRIDSSGRLLVNGTTAEGTAKLQSHLGTSGYCAAMYSIQNQADYIEFLNDGGQVGSIRRSGGSAVVYNTTSDYRLKENVSYDFDATTRLKQLRPARFNFIGETDRTVDGFLAHEVSNVVPEAISGTHNETETKEKVVVNVNGKVIAENIEQADWEAGKIADENGNTQYPTDSTWEATKVVPVYQGIDQSKLVPLLVKTIQELEARITTLENA